MASIVRLGLGLRVGASCHHCSGLHGLPFRPSFRHAGADAGMNGGSWTSGSLRAWGRLPCLGPGLVSQTSRRPWRASLQLGWRSGAQPGEGTLPGVSHCQGLTSDP